MKRVEGVGDAHIFKGDPRMRPTDIDQWFQGILTHTNPVKARAHLWGADAGLCARRNVLLENNVWVQSTTTAASAAYMAIGVAVEDLLAESLRKKGRLINQGMYLVEIPEVKVRGKIDLLIRDHEEQLTLVEVKTCGALPTEPRVTHLAQAQTYAAISGIHRVIITYISRNVATQPWGPGLSMRSFPVECDIDSLTGRLHTALVSRFAGDAEKLPPVPAHFRKHTECHFCDFRDAFCWKARPGSKPTSPPEYAPLQEISVEELANIYAKADILSQDLMSNTLYRKKETLEKLLIDYPQREENELLLREELSKTIQEIV